MDAGTAIIGAASIAVCVLPFFWLYSVRKKAEKKMLKSLTDFATEHNGFISRSEIFGDMAIGFDEQNDMLFFYKKSGTEVVMQHVELAAIKTCEVINTSKTFNDKGGARTIIEKSELSFTPVAGNQPAIVLEFYDRYKNVQPNGELQYMERWAQWIKDRLKRTK
jgi:hypothetical protein